MSLGLLSWLDDNSPSTLWILGINLGSLGMAASAIILERLAGLSTDLEGWAFSSQSSADQ